jgi:hypothetical protein
MQRKTLSSLTLVTALACSHGPGAGGPAGGGAGPSAGNAAGGSTAGAATSAGQSALGGVAASTGGSATSLGGVNAGATTGAGANSGSSSGAAAGASQSSGGGSANGGSANGGSANGGSANGGSANGGSANGGSAGMPAGGAAAGCPRACGPTTDQLFDTNKLATLRVKIAAADLKGYTEATWLDALWAKWSHCPPFNYLPAEMTYESPDGVGNVTLQKVGIRLRGSHMRGFTQTQGLKLDFQVLDTPGPEGKRRFGDLNRLNILSVETDPSHMVQCLAYKAYRDFGVPSPRCNFMKVYVNGNYYGLLEHVEQVNKGYLRRHFGTNKGSLYGASPSMGECTTGGFKDSLARLEYSGDTFSSYAAQYQLTSATSAEAEQNLIPMLKCGDATQTSDEAFKTCIADWIDVDEWLKVIAVESVLPELESFIGYYRNYYLYFKADATAPHMGRFVVWPWDLDNSFDRGRCTPSNCDVLTAVDSLYRTQRAKLVQRLTTVFRKQYCSALNSFMSTVYKPTLVSDLAKIVEPGIMNEPTVSTTMWQSAVSALQNHITMRSSSAQTTISAACQ